MLDRSCPGSVNRDLSTYRITTSYIIKYIIPCVVSSSPCLNTLYGHAIGSSTREYDELCCHLSRGVSGSIFVLVAQPLLMNQNNKQKSYLTYILFVSQCNSNELPDTSLVQNDDVRMSICSTVPKY